MSNLKRARDRLLSCLPLELVASEAARNLIQAMPIPLPNVVETGPEVSALPWGETEFLREQGVDTESAPNARVRADRDQLKLWFEANRGAELSAEVKENGVRIISASVRSLTQQNVSPEQASFGWETVAKAC